MHSASAAASTKPTKALRRTSGSSSPSWLPKNVGTISAKDCIAFGVTGPVLRASGVKWDLRKAQPYAAYSEFDFEIPTGTNGDTYDRYLVRMAEMRQSLRIIEQAVNRIPEGPIMAKVPKVIKPPGG